MRHRLRFLAPLLLVLLFAAVVPAAAGSDSGGEDARVEPARLVVKVFYRTPTGKAPLVGAQVFVRADGASYFKCTNAKGRAVFKGFEVGTEVTILATGPAADGSCSNSRFRNPDTGKQMLSVFYKGHHGVREFDVFTLDGSKTTRKLVAKTPGNQRRICFGLKTTYLGTNGDDEITGTMDSDVINARGGDDRILAGGGNDIVCAGPGNDVVYGEDGGDLLFGERGSDGLFGGEGDGDLTHGGGGEDHCEGADIYISCESK